MTIVEEICAGLLSNNRRILEELVYCGGRFNYAGKAFDLVLHAGQQENS